ncbi:phage gene 29 protein family protein [Nocardia sp. CA-128927]|uniref:phage gene 29 protein family protein n=1 Tax=Nocardia sp. CA-128927 TaxID=3239975 RepID=UPI003D991411
MSEQTPPQAPAADNPPPLRHECTVCGTRRCPCVHCHRKCGLDHSPRLPTGAFPTVDNCNCDCPTEAFLPFLVGLPGMRGASMAIPIAGLRQWSQRLWNGGARRVERQVEFYWPPKAGELNPMFASGEWKAEPPPADWSSEVDINALSGVMQAELQRQFAEREAAAEAARPADVARATVSHITRFDPNEHTVAVVLAHLRTASPAEVARVIARERATSQRAGILKRYKET